jgi:hypothetical protein
VAREVGRALEALAAGHGAANVIPLAEGAAAWRSRAAPLAKGALADARSFVESLGATSDRQALRPIERALDDPDVEEVWILAAGEPVRSEADRDGAAVLRRVRELWLRRGVRVNVVLPLGAAAGADATLAQAARRDERSRLEAFWRPIAEATGGACYVRERVRPVETGPAPRRGGVAHVGSPTPTRR